jgi:ADP-heptose:LPS heptosyltransferase
MCRLDSDGDVLLSGPAVRAVAASGARVTYLCGGRGRSAVRLLPGVDEVVVFDAAWVLAKPPAVERAGIDALIDDVAARAIDQAFILTSFHQSPLPLALLLRMAGVRTIAAASVDYPGSLLDVRHGVDDDVHEVERSLLLVARLGYHLAPGDKGRLEIRIDGDAWPELAGPTPYVVVHPGASVPARAWSAPANAELVGALVEAGWQVVVTGGSTEARLAEQVAGEHHGVRNLAGATNLAELARVLSRATVVIAGNTGPAHLAAAVGTPVVSIFAPTVPIIRWHPWMVPHVVLGQQDIGCAGCRSAVCPVPGQPCIGGIAPADVVRAVATLAALRPVAA